MGRADDWKSRESLQGRANNHQHQQKDGGESYLPSLDGDSPDSPGISACEEDPIEMERQSPRQYSKQAL
jgi:hypothetical protein